MFIHSDTDISRKIRSSLYGDQMRACYVQNFGIIVEKPSKILIEMLLNIYL